MHMEKKIEGGQWMKVDWLEDKIMVIKVRDDGSLD